MELDAKVAVITGASMGIGEELAKLLAARGATVVLTSRDAARAEAARARVGRPERTLALACDVRNREEIERVASLTLHNFGRIDIWINNAGHGLEDSVEKMDMAQCRSMFDTNFFGTVDAMQVVIPIMRRQGSGAIINISSVAGHACNRVRYSLSDVWKTEFPKDRWNTINREQPFPSNPQFPL